MLFASAGCSSFGGRHAVPVPADALAATQLGSNRFAVLAGSAQAKTVTILGLADGAIVRTFGVTREANGIADGGGGSLLLSVGGESGGRAFGAVERWNNVGVKSGVVPLPGAALGMTRDLDGESYVLLAGRGDARAALPVEVASMHLGAPIPLEAGAQTLQQCKIGATPYLLYEGGANGPVVVRGIGSSETLRSRISATAPDCGENGHVYAITRGFATRSIIVLSAPSLDQVGEAPVANDATEVLDIGNQKIVTLNAASGASTLEVVPYPGTAKSAT